MDHTLDIGRIVHYRLDQGTNKGDYRPAIVVRIWSPDHPDSAIQLQVLTDASNDALPPVHWATSVTHGSGLHQWLWPDEPKPGKDEA